MPVDEERVDTCHGDVDAQVELVSVDEKRIAHVARRNARLVGWYDAARTTRRSVMESGGSSRSKEIRCRGVRGDGGSGEEVSRKKGPAVERGLAVFRPLRGTAEGGSEEEDLPPPCDDAEVESEESGGSKGEELTWGWT